jgi:hypothetical protein
MRRILLLLEDYNEQIFLETLLKKLGFDAESIRSEASVSEKMMAFSPDLVIATGDGHKINGGRVSKKVKKHKAHAKLLLLFPRSKLRDISLIALDADGAVEIPLNPRTVIASICQLTAVDVTTIMTKFDKLPVGRDTSDDVVTDNSLHIITGKKNVKKSPAPDLASVPRENDHNRVARYAAYLQNVPPAKENGFVHSQIQSEVSEIRKYEKEHPETEDIDKQRKAFVRALFKK